MHATGFRHGGRLWVTCLGLLLVGTIARADDLSKEERDAGFVAMFNGKDFTGWRFEGKESPPKELPDNWKVEEGVIKLSGGGKPHLGSAKSYRDFEMKFEWRAVKENYNSGFFIRSGEKVGANQINLAKAHEGAFIGGKINGAKKSRSCRRSRANGTSGMCSWSATKSRFGATGNSPGKRPACNQRKATSACKRRVLRWNSASCEFAS